MMRVLPYVYFGLLLVTIAPIYNAITSIIVAGSILVILTMTYKNKEIKRYSIPKYIWFAFLVFISGITISSIAIHDTKSINECIKTCYWMIPFFMIYIFSLSIDATKIEKISVYAFNIGLFITAMPAVVTFFRTYKRVSGLYGNPNHFASMLDIILPFAIILTIYFAKKKIKQNILFGCLF